MSFAVNWHVEKQIIYLKLWDVVTSEELIQANHQAIELMRVGTQPVHIIFDTLGVTEFPTNLRWLIHMSQRNKTVASGWNIIVANNRVIQYLVYSMLRLFKVSIQTCTSLEEAYTFLNQLHSPDTLAS